MEGKWLPPTTVTSPRAVIALSVIMLLVGTLAVALRFHGRRTLKATIRLDDWFMLSAYIFFMVMLVVVFVGVAYKIIGYPTAVAIKAGISVYKIRMVSLNLTIFTTFTLGSIKLSALLFFRRVLCVSERRSKFRTTIDIFIVIVSLWTLTYFLFPLLICGSHLSAYWTSAIEFGKYCKVAPKNLLTASITDLILDVFIVLLPIQRIWSLQMTTPRRLGVIFVFLTAIISLAASAARMAIVGKATTDPADDEDLETSAIFFTWVLEAGFGLLAVNLPSLWYLRTKLAPEKVLRSAQSVFSLKSRFSKTSDSSLPTRAVEAKTSRRGSSAKASRTSTKFEAEPEEVPELPKNERGINVATEVKVESV